MNFVSRMVVKHPKAIILISLLLLLPAFYGMVHTKINYDIFTYLPSSLNSVQGQNILEDDFKVAGNAFLLLDKTSDWEAEKLKDRILQVDGVEKVVWVNDWTDITVPRQYLPSQLRDQFYKGNSTLLQIQFGQGAGEEKTVQAINEIKGILDTNAHLGGVSAVLAGMRGLIDHERVLYLIVGVLLSALVLSLTLSSTVIPVLFLCSIGVAIVYNLGSNIFLGSISYVTSAITAVLQLGVTMDFSIFLMHRYLEEKHKQPTVEAAMGEAIHKTFLAIGASSLTAMAGFLALSVMSIGLGKDMGVVMAKGVAFGVLVSLTLLPALIVTFDGLITRFRHRILMPDFHWTARIVSRRYWVLVALFVVFLIPAYYGREHVKVFYNIADALPQDMQAIQDTHAVKDAFGCSDTLYLITPSGQEWQLQKLTDAIKNMRGVVEVMSESDMVDAAVPPQYVSEQVQSQFTKGDYTYTVIQSKWRPADKEATVLINNIRQEAGRYYKTYYLSGESVLTDDMIKLTQKDAKKVDAWSIGAILAILALAFGSISLPVILVLVIELAILINLAVPFYTGTTVPFIAVMTVGAIQLGSTVNYAILMVSRFKEELVDHDKYTAAANAVRGTAKAVVTSALTLFCATIGVGMISQIQMIGSLTVMIARGALISMFAILFFLPAILIVMQSLVNATTWRWHPGQTKLNGEG